MSACFTVARRLGLIDADGDHTAIVDATGLDTRHVSTHLLRRCGLVEHHVYQAAWPKLTAVFCAATHLIAGVVVGRGPSQDSPQFAPAVRQAAANLRPRRVIADKGYDAEHNHALCRHELGIRSTIIPLNQRTAGRRWPRTRYRRLMRRRFPKIRYRQRSQAESGFSRHKRRLGSTLTARTEPAQFAEMRMRVLTHNLMIIAQRN